LTFSFFHFSPTLNTLKFSQFSPLSPLFLCVINCQQSKSKGQMLSFSNVNLILDYLKMRWVVLENSAKFDKQFFLYVRVETKQWKEKTEQDKYPRGVEVVSVKQKKCICNRKMVISRVMYSGSSKRMDSHE